MSVDLQDGFVQKLVDMKSLTDAEYLSLLKAVPDPSHSLGWVCLLNAVVYMACTYYVQTVN